jgi:hypothetical protein
MTWLDEWKLMMEQRQEQEPEYDMNLYVAIRDMCQRHKVIYQVAIYNEYIKWENNYGHLYRVINGSPVDVPTQEHLTHFAAHSETIRFQKEAMKRIVELEQFAQKNKIRFHDDSIMEKIALAAHYAGLRGGG